jgi:hypothetical protein
MSGVREEADTGRDADPRGAEPGSRAGESGISREEREEILAQIDEAVAKTRAPAGAADLAYKGERSGAVLPLVVNAAAVLVIAAGALLFSWFSDRREESLTRRPSPILTAEGRIVGAVKRESEERLAGKDREITDIQGKLAEIGGQLETLKSESAGTIRTREEQLRAALAAELASEREKLAKGGASAASIDQQVQLIEDRKTRELASALAAFRSQADAELAKKETAINAQFSSYQQSLEQARTEKARLEAEMSAQRADLLAKAQGDTAELTAALGSLREQQQKEQLVSDQISASYRLAEAEIQAGRGEGAIGALDALVAYLDQPAIAALPAVQRRKPVELFLVGALKDLVAARASPAAAAVRPDVRKAVTDAVAEGDALYASARYKEAIEKYGEALEALRDISPGLPRAGVRLADAGWRKGYAELVAREDLSAKPLLERADRLARSGSWREAVSAYAGAIRGYPNSSLAARALAGMESSVDRLLKARELARARADAERKASVDEKTRALSEGLSASGRAAATAAGAAQKELIDLLEAKVKMREVLGSDPVAAQHPGLAGKFDKYLDLFGEEKRGEGRASALRDVVAVVDYLQGKKAREQVIALLDRYGADAPRSAFQQMLERLRGLFN